MKVLFVNCIAASVLLLSVPTTVFAADVFIGAEASAKKDDAASENVVRSKEMKRWSIGTNALQWLNFGTPNLALGVAVGRHFSLELGGRYNSWKFKTKKTPIWNQQQTGWLGFRYWPWYVYSGFWLGLKAQYSGISTTGIWRPALETGQGVGARLSLGYTFMLSSYCNLELGMGAWGGRYLKYTLYGCPECMDIREQGPRWFGTLDDISLSFHFLF